MNNPLKASIVLIVLLFVVQTTTLSFLPRNKVVECKGIKLTRLGCYGDKPKDRAIPKLVLTARDITSPVYSGEQINWKKWDDFMTTFICNCSRVSLSKGYSVVGLQYYGECWSGPDSVTARYAKYGSSKLCVSGSSSRCKGGLDCIGKDNTNFVYRVQKDVTSPKPSPKPSTNPTGSGTSTAKRPQSPTTSPNPCYLPTAANIGCQNLQIPCVPPCQQMVPPALPMPYQRVPALGLPQVQGRYPQRIQCVNGCPARCAPKCQITCCRQPFGGPMMSPNIYPPVSPIGFPQGGLQSPLSGWCNNGCPARCAPKCKITCCRQPFGGPMMSANIYPPVSPIGFPQGGLQSPLSGYCNNGCPARCAPKCQIGCCRQSFGPPMAPLKSPVQYPLHSAFGFKQGGYPVSQGGGCYQGCPTRCAPRCTVGCCRWFGRTYKKSKINKYIAPNLDDDQ